ncbi:uncharacterized protein ColSpa_05597 [Colletotrichum spaethianum]|uniref:Uncharacterized protein n=1 Tax=Colletotrichum spaethianum TaxID=700344 RepID=A0AA37LB55_9PEZI|nr:uncharacterized protein ColSpa_05597 [Colletotrichum spaethianum]GKT45416.1 hypothetical protein ColSpa_05597 [Colletotrichum spaethianum]
MIATAISAASSKGKGVMMGILLLRNGIVVPIEYNWDPANPPLWSLRPKDRDSIATDKSSSLQIRGTGAKTSGITPLIYNWDPQDPPLWTIRPKDRNDFLASTMSSDQIETLNSDGGSVPCANKNKPATLYHVYGPDDCPPKYQFLPFAEGNGQLDTCEGWNKGWYTDNGCTTFCETSTRFEWAQEVPFSHSECHYPIKCGMTKTESVSSGWNVGVSAKIQFWKALKIGVTGGWHHSWGTARAKKWDVDLKEGQCGYFTFVPVKKVVCGGITEPSWQPNFDWDGCNYSPPKNSEYCDNQLWTIKDSKNSKEEVPDGTIIFVYTDCLTRLPLPMSEQDPVYRAPGVALSHDVLDSIQQGWVWNTCYMWRMGVEGYLGLYIHGSGFKDSMIGPEGTHLRERINHCVRAAEGVIRDVKFEWYENGYPGDDAKVMGAAWLFMADVPENIRPGCIGDAIMELGGTTMHNCVGDKFWH